jgi:MoaA/NifB/PqqE/SkfB family radical SAM enzyme
MIPYESIKWLHVEQTSRCNASCPSCRRNNFGYGLAPGVDESDLPVSRLAEVLDILPNLETVQYCGSLGDAIAAKNFKESLQLVLDRNISSIQIQTNGSLKTVKWWGEIGELLKDRNHTVWFALDGLEDTHAIYRQNTDFNKIIENAKAFIATGGRAIWQFIPFKHNQHQILDAIKMSQRLGFEKFEFIRNARYTSKAFHHRTGLPIDISPWDKQAIYDKHKGDPVDAHKTRNNVVYEKDCMHLSFPSLYLGSAGNLSPCCYFLHSDIEDMDIDGDFQRKSWDKQCRLWCGSVEQSVNDKAGNDSQRNT